MSGISSGMDNAVFHQIRKNYLFIFQKYILICNHR